MPKLDGTETIKPTPFDAHDTVLRAGNESEHKEHPKAIDHVAMPDGHLEPVVARDADHEAELKAKMEEEK
jgi:hypothetical protein